MSIAKRNEKKSSLSRMNQSAVVNILTVLVLVGFIFFYFNGLFDPPKTQEQFAPFSRPLIQDSPQKMFFDQLANAGLAKCPKGKFDCSYSDSTSTGGAGGAGGGASDYADSNYLTEEDVTYNIGKRGASTWGQPDSAMVDPNCIPVPGVKIPMPVSCVKTELYDMYQLSMPGYSGVALSPVMGPPTTLMPIRTFANLTESQKQAYAKNLTPTQLATLRSQFNFYNATTQHEPEITMASSCGYTSTGQNACGPCTDTTKVCAWSGGGTNMCIAQNMVGKDSPFGKPWVKCTEIGKEPEKKDDFSKLMPIKDLVTLTPDARMRYAESLTTVQRDRLQQQYTEYLKSQAN